MKSINTTNASAGLDYRFKTGIKELDEALHGGIPAKLSILLLNEPENDVSVFCQQLTWAGLQNGEACYYFAYDHHPEIIRSSMLRFGWDIKPFEERGDLVIIDCYSARLGVKGNEKFMVENPFDLLQLTEIFRGVEQKLRATDARRPVRGIVDSFSPIIDNNGFTDVLRVAMKLNALVKRGTYLGIGVVHKGIHGPVNEFAAKHMAEGIIELYTREEDYELAQYLRVTKMALTHFNPKPLRYSLTQKGLKILSAPKSP